jgi:hypothetical protein
MRVWQGQKGYALVALAGVLVGMLAAAGCQEDPDRDPQVSGTAGEGARLLKDPQLTMPGDPLSPGLEPPVSNDGLDNAGASAGPATPVPAAGSPSTTPPPTGAPIGAGGNGGSASGAAGMGMSAAGSSAGEPMGEDRDAGTDAGSADPCESAPECGLLAPCSDASLDCISLDACDHAVCIAVQAACQAQCGSDECAVLESYPEQIACN